MKCLVQRTYTVTEGVYVQSRHVPDAIRKVKAMKNPRWFTVARDDAEWCAENVPQKRKAPR